MQHGDLQAVLAAVAMPMAGIDRDGRVVSVNGQAIDVLGGDRTGMHYITAFRQPALLDAIELTLEDPEPRFARYSNRSGQRDLVWRVHVVPCPVPNLGCAILLSFEDVSSIEHSEQIRRDFVANVSHELRTPLTALLGFIETLQGAARQDPNAQDRFLSIMAGEAGRMAHLVDELLSLSRVEETERMRPLEEVDLAELIPSVCKSLHGLAERSEVILECDLDPDAPVLLGGDAGQLRQVLVNLIENGLKYGSSGGKVTISLSGIDHDPALRGPGVLIMVTDHGEGIAPHHIARLTERFYRVDNHRSRELGGTGLGLAIVKHIISRHRGRMQIKSTLGEGSRFCVYLPVS